MDMKLTPRHDRVLVKPDAAGAGAGAMGGMGGMGGMGMM